MPAKDITTVDKISGKISILENENREIASLNASLNTKIDTLKSKCARLEVERQNLKTKVVKLNEENGKNCAHIDELSKKLAEVDAEKKKFKKSIDENLQKANTEIERLLRQNEKLGKLLRSSNECINNEEQFPCEVTFNHPDIISIFPLNYHNNTFIRNKISPKNQKKK